VPPVIAGAALSAAAGWASAAAFGTLASFSLAGTFLTSLALGGLSMIMQKKPKQSDVGSISEGITRQFRAAVAGREVVYGEVRKSGSIAMVANSDNNNYFHYTILLATHEIAGVDEFIVNDESIPLDYIDSSGNVIDGTYNGHLKLVVYNGTEVQTADPTLVAEVTEWTTAHRLQGIAYIYARLKWNRDTYPDGTPTVSCWLRGKKIVEYRDIIESEERITEDGDGRVTESTEIRVTEDSGTDYTYKFSNNIALMVADNMTDQKWGFKTAVTDINLDAIVSSANLCDEMVNTKPVNHDGLGADGDIISLDGEVLKYYRGDLVSVSSSTITGLADGNYYVIPYQRWQNPRIKLATSLQNATDGVSITLTSDGTCDLTKIAEPRYHGGGVIDMTTRRKDNLENILSGMGGVCYTVGLDRIIKGASYESPVYAFDEDDLVGGIEVYQTKVTRRDRFNQVQGKFISQINNGNEADYPMVKSTTYVAADGEDLKRELDLPFTQRSQTAERIAKTALERARQEIKFKAKFNLEAFKVQAGDNIYFSFTQYGWENKVFEVIGWTRGSDGNGAPFIELDLHENASAVYDFIAADEESPFDPAPNTTLANPRVVQPVGLFGLTSVPVANTAGDLNYKISMSWDATTDAYVLQNGKYQIQYKESSNPDYTGNVLLDGTATETELFQSQIDVLYDVRIRAINSLGVQSAWTTVTGFIAGSSIVATQIDLEYDSGASRDFEVDSGAAEDLENDS